MCFITAFNGLNAESAPDSGKINPLKIKLRPNWTEPCFKLTKLGDFHEFKSGRPGGRKAHPYQSLLNLLDIGAVYPCPHRTVYCFNLGIEIAQLNYYQINLKLSKSLFNQQTTDNRQLTL
jgi:hypothetical protein